MVSSITVGMTVMSIEYVDQRNGVIIFRKEKGNFHRLVVEAMYDGHQVISPLIAKDENPRIAAIDRPTTSPSDFRRFLSHPDHALCPIQHGFAVATLGGRECSGVWNVNRPTG